MYNTVNVDLPRFSKLNTAPFKSYMKAERSEK